MLDTRSSRIEVPAAYDRGAFRMASAGSVRVCHVPAGAIRDLPEHYRVEAGPGACDLKPDALDELIADLQALRSLTRSPTPKGERQ